MSGRKKQKLAVTTATPRAWIGAVPVFCSFDELRDIESMKPNPKNPNRHPESQVQLLASIILHQGFRAPITVSRRSGMIVRGHCRLEAARILNLPTVPVDLQDYASESEEYADLVADNRLAELSEMDNAALAELMQAISSDQIDLTGYTGKEIEDILKEIAGSEAVVITEDDDEADELPAVPFSKQGDLWTLRQHKLLCGDCTKQADVAAVMGNRKAQCVWTDPPYGVSYISQSGKFEMIVNDDLVGDKLVNDLLVPAFINMRAWTRDNAAFYIWHASASRKEFDAAMLAAGLQENQIIIWAKNGITLGHGDYQWAHEPCYYASKAGQQPLFLGDRSQPTVWRIVLKESGRALAVIAKGITIIDGHGGQIYICEKGPKNKKGRVIRLQTGQAIDLLNENAGNTLWEIKREPSIQHPTQKPVETATRAFLNSTREGDMVADYFAGSGTALIAAEKTGRVFAGLEIDPKYVDISINRFVRIYGREGVWCLRDGQRLSLDQVRSE